MGWWMITSWFRRMICSVIIYAAVAIYLKTDIGEIGVIGRFRKLGA